MSGGDEQQRDTGGRRGWWLVGALAVIGAAVGAFAGYRLDPDVQELVPSLAVAGFGLGGLIGLLLLVPVGLWRAWRRRARRRAAAAAELARQAAEAPVPERLEQAEEAAALTSQEQLEPERGDEEDAPAEQPELEPELPPPPAGEEPGWYPDPRDGVRRYWDGHNWTGHVWGGRTRERTRKSRGRR